MCACVCGWREKTENESERERKRWRERDGGIDRGHRGVMEKIDSVGLESQLPCGYRQLNPSLIRGRFLLSLK